jgi:hypothetical protein
MSKSSIRPNLIAEKLPGDYCKLIVQGKHTTTKFGFSKTTAEELIEQLELALLHGQDKEFNFRYPKGKLYLINQTTTLSESYHLIIK